MGCHSTIHVITVTSNLPSRNSNSGVVDEDLILKGNGRKLHMLRSQHDHTTGGTGITHSESDYSSYYFEDIPLFHNSSANGHDAWKELQGRVLI